jgi:hypothetical protein
MKQPIAGLKGIKPRLEKPNGKLSREEAHRLDLAYRIHRNEALQLRNHPEAMLLAKARGELITREKAVLQASYLMRSLQQKIWYFPARYGNEILRTLGLEQDRQKELTGVLKRVAAEFMASIRELPSCVEEGWLETLTNDEDPEIASKAKERSAALKRRAKKVK